MLLLFSPAVLGQYLYLAHTRKTKPHNRPNRTRLDLISPSKTCNLPVPVIKWAQSWQLA